MIAIIDYGCGNLFSVVNALVFLGVECKITGDKQIIDKSHSIILPGVGAFANARKMLDSSGLTGFLCEQARVKPFLGICLGAQLLFDESDEIVVTDGLGLIRGNVRRINAGGMKIPHMGWNSLKAVGQSPLLNGVDEDSHVYFVHSYKINTDSKYIVSYCNYGERIPAIVQSGNIYGTQFHPEKSGWVGLKILENFSRIN